MCDCWDNRPEFFDFDFATARKEHRCTECLSVIHRGERYERYTGKWESGIETFKTCEACVSLRDALRNGDCIVFGELCQYVFDAKQDGIAVEGMDEFESRRTAGVSA